MVGEAQKNIFLFDLVGKSQKIRILVGKTQKKYYVNIVGKSQKKNFCV